MTDDFFRSLNRLYLAIVVAFATADVVLALTIGTPALPIINFLAGVGFMLLLCIAVVWLMDWYVGRGSR